jgi:single-strand DNA-binding protein
MTDSVALGASAPVKVSGRAKASTTTTLASAINVVVLRGRVSRPPETRELSSGAILVAYEVVVAAGESAGRAEAVPVVWPSAPPNAAELAEGDDVVVVGRVRRRFFRAGGVIQSRTEVVAEQVIPARQRARSGRLVSAAAARLAAL